MLPNPPSSWHSVTARETDQVTEKHPPMVVSFPLDPSLSITELMGQVLKKEKKSSRQRREQKEILQVEEEAAGSPPGRRGSSRKSSRQRMGNSFYMVSKTRQ